MGCAASMVDSEGKVRVCKERKMLMKRALGFRKEFADSQLAYLRALKNVGVTLRQFTESESLELEDPAYGPVLPPPPPPPHFPSLPPSPPPPPTSKSSEEEIMDMDEDESHTPPPPPLWEFWDPFSSSLPQCERKVDSSDPVEDKWEEAKSEFEENEDEEIVSMDDVVNKLPLEKEDDVLIDDKFAFITRQVQDDADMATVARKKNWTLPGVIRELDDYFVKASDCCKDVSVFVDVNVGDTFRCHSNGEKRERTNSARVFSSLTWSKSSRSLTSTKDSGDKCGPNEPCCPGAHCVTLEKLYAAEQRLYRDVKENEITKSELEKKSKMLQKLEEEDHELTKAHKYRSIVENLQSRALFLQESITSTCSTMLKLIDEELHPQLVALTSGLMSMYQKMHESHQIQSQIAQQLTDLRNEQKMEPTTQYHQNAAAQLKNEITLWYTSFSQLTKFQREYANALARWIKLRESIVDVDLRGLRSSEVHQVSEQWLSVLDKLPDKMVSDAIKSLLSAIETIITQQRDELLLHKRSDKLENKLERESIILLELEQKFVGSFTDEEMHTMLDPKHPLSVKKAKMEVLKKQVDDQKAKYTNSVHVTRAMILNNLQSTLPNVFRALEAFSNAYAQSLEAVLCSIERIEQDDDGSHKASEIET